MDTRCNKRARKFHWMVGADDFFRNARSYVDPHEIKREK